MNAKDVIKLLKSDGWLEIRVKGSHHIFKHPTKTSLVVVPMHGSKDLGAGLLRAIERGADVKLRSK
ncbi:MAG: type II toxin-antitoxin system HicA family toxin [Proteobacteria bacterium]|nr:type II toxin-antitoxin system HicA family toxin [Pseudomonadota bacterium]MBI3498940.1 type II toxin-antitoxin system HicA family toxin [Pseudomonadota bacterium]